MFPLLFIANLPSIEELIRVCEKQDVEQITSNDQLLQKVQVLLVTSTEHARLATLAYLKPFANGKHFSCVLIGGTEEQLHLSLSCTIGMYGSCVTGVVINKRNLHTLAETALNQFPNLCAVFTVGVVYGVMRHVKMWDVIASSKLYTSKINQDGEIKSDTPPIPASQFLCEWISQSPSWPDKDNVLVTRLEDNNITSPCMKQGSILSCYCFKDDNSKLDLLNMIYSEDIFGIEMDGTASLSDYCRRSNIHFMIVKAVGSLGDSKYDRVCQPTAALLAADCLHHYLSDPQLPHNLAASRGWYCLLWLSL